MLHALERGLVEHLVRRSAELHFLHICTGGNPFEMR